jgi:serine/threonine-protein kinase
MIGTIVGNYKLTDKLGEGGMGAVYKGIDLMLEREVALKALRPELLSRADLVERFRSEAVTLAKLNHPHIATLYSFFRQGDEYFMVLEFVPGETLEAVVRRAGAVPGEQAASLIYQALAGLEHAHDAGIIHRDIKLANLMLAPNNVVKVMDFGIARALGHDRLTRAGRMVGTIEYMSPEQIRGQEADVRSDLYSLGVALYELVTGRLPFDSDSEYELMRAQIEDAPPAPREFAPHISPALEQVILRALAKQPDARFQTAEEFRAALAELMPVVPEVATTRKTPVPATRLGSDVAWTGSNETVKSTRWQEIANADKVRRFNWKHGAAAATLTLALVTSFAAMIPRTTSDTQAKISSAPVATPTPLPTVEPTPVSTPIAPTPVPAATVAPTLEPTPMRVTTPQLTPNPTTPVKPETNKRRSDKQPEVAAAIRAEVNAKLREIQRKRKLADEILSR